MAVDLEKLVVTIDGKIDGLREAMEDARDESDKTRSIFDSNFARMGKSFVNISATAVATMAAAATAISTMVVASAKSTRELDILAKQAKLTGDDFRSLSFATRQYGVDADQIADISKDVADRVGEFAAVGTGAFQDFVDVVGLTKQEALTLADQFQYMSSDQILGQMVGMMEEANATGSQMTFVMESMGNDASRLIPLFADQAKELNRLRDGYNKINESMKLTTEQQEALTQTAQDWDTLTTAMGNSSNLISATLAPILSDFFNGVIEIVPDATQAIVDFINTFKEAEQINSIQAVDRQIESLNKQLEELPQKAQRVADMGGGFARGISQARGQDPDAAEKKQLEERIAELKARREELESEQKKLADAQRFEGGEIKPEATGGEVFTGLDGKTSSRAEAVTEIDELTQSFATRTELITSAFASEFDILMQQKQREEDYLKQAREQGLIDEEQYLKSKADLAKFYGNEQVKAGKATFENLLSSGASQSRALFEINKVYTKSQVALKIPEAVQNSYAYGSALGGPIGGSIAAGIALTASLAQLQAVNSMSFGGGAPSSGAPSSGGGTIAFSTPQQDQTPTIEVGVSDVSTNNATQRIIISTDSGDDIFDGISKGVERSRDSGRT
jgi:hypothetical protein